MLYNVAAICGDFLGQCELIIAINIFNSKSGDLLFHIISHYILLFFYKIVLFSPEVHICMSVLEMAC